MRGLPWVLPLLLCAVPLQAQDYFPRIEFSAGCSYSRFGRQSWLGCYGSVAKNLNRWLGIALDVNRFHRSETLGSGIYVVRERRHFYTFLCGPRFTSRDAGRIVPFLQVLFGAARSFYDYSQIINDLSFAGSSEHTRFAMSFGGGIDIKTMGPLAFRVIQADYLRVYFSPSYFTAGLRLSGGVSLRIGKRL